MPPCNGCRDAKRNQTGAKFAWQSLRSRRVPRTRVSQIPKAEETAITYQNTNQTLHAPASSSQHSLPPVAAMVDEALLEIDEEVNWLMALSPLHSLEMWEQFVASGYKQVAEFEYQNLSTDLVHTRKRLHDLPVADIELPLLEALLTEKQRELDRQIELVRLRGTEGFVTASIDLFGTADSELLRTAHRILEDTPRRNEPEEADADCDEIVAAALAEIEWYREKTANMTARVIVLDDLHSMMMVAQGDLYLDRHSRIPRARVQPLIQHEVGTHIITAHNGARQPLRQLEAGLAHFDALQEGLGVLSEYLCGYLPPERLRIIAARVIGADMAVKDCDTAEIFHCLHDDHGLPAHNAFDVAVRAMRGGGLTKDVVYLRGLCDLLAWLANGGDFEDLFIGQFSLQQMSALKHLVADGLIHAPELLPRYLESETVRQRLERCRSLSVEDLYQQEPET